jgi:hypothetical protein
MTTNEIDLAETVLCVVTADGGIRRFDGVRFTWDRSTEGDLCVIEKTNRRATGLFPAGRWNGVYREGASA